MWLTIIFNKIYLERRIHDNCIVPYLEEYHSFCTCKAESAHFCKTHSTGTKNSDWFFVLYNVHYNVNSSFSIIEKIIENDVIITKLYIIIKFL